MFDFDWTRKQQSEFVQEQAYVEDYFLFYEPPKKKESDENRRGVVEIDLNNGKTIEVT